MLVLDGMEGLLRKTELTIAATGRWGLSPTYTLTRARFATHLIFRYFVAELRTVPGMFLGELRVQV